MSDDGSMIDDSSCSNDGDMIIHLPSIGMFDERRLLFDAGKALLAACTEGDLEVVRGLLTLKDRKLLRLKDLDVNFTIERERVPETPLIAACQNGHLEVVRELLKQPSLDVNCGLDRGLHFDSSPLIEASVMNHWEIVRELLNYGNVGVGDALRFAVAEGHFVMVCELLKHDSVNVNYADSCGDTPLIIASHWDNWEIARELLKHNDVDVNIVNGLVDSDGNVLEIPQSNGSRSQILVELLNPHKRREIAYVNTPLIAASLFGYFQVVRELLKHDKVDVNIGIEYGHTPLVLASSFGRYKVVRELLKHENVDVNFAVECGYTPLTLASHMEHWDVVGELLKHNKVNFNVQCKFGFTVLMWASLKGKIEVVSELLKRDNLDRELKNVAGSTALDVARNSGWTEIATLLEQHHSNPVKSRKHANLVKSRKRMRG